MHKKRQAHAVLTENKGTAFLYHQQGIHYFRRRKESENGITATIRCAMETVTLTLNNTIENVSV